MTRQVLYINGKPVEAGPRYRPPDPPAPLPPPMRPGCVPSCCGALHAGNGGHRNDHSYECDYRPTRTFDHLADEPEGRRFSAAARAMRGEGWWHGKPVFMVPGDVAGEIADSVEIRRKRRALQALQDARDSGMTVEEIADQIAAAIGRRGGRA